LVLHEDIRSSEDRLYVTFIDKDGDEHKLAVNKGDNLLTVAQHHDIEMEGKWHIMPICLYGRD